MKKILYRWHTRIGICAAAFVLLFSATGILVNHSEGLRLDERHVQFGWLLDLYRIAPDAAPVAYRVGEDWLIQLGRRLYFNDRELMDDTGQLHGAVSAPGYLVAAVGNRLALLGRGGELVEVLSGAEGVPSGMRRLGTDTEGRLVVGAAHGHYRADLEGLSWRESARLDADWAVREELPDALYQSVVRDWRGKGLSLERVLLDLHSGRLWGGVGTLVYDAMAVLFIFLALSGSWLWCGRRP